MARRDYPDGGHERGDPGVGRGFIRHQYADPLLDLFIKKGFVTQKEAEQVEAEAEALRANESQMQPAPLSRWKISEGIKKVE